MTGSLIFVMPGNEAMAAGLSSRLDLEIGALEVREFPDGEIYVRIVSSVVGRPVALLATLSDPNPKILPLIFAAKTLKELGASRVGLIAPYLAYMRQDRRFSPGEAASARHFASLLSSAFDWLATVDPHLHRIQSMSEIFTIPTVVAHAAADLAAWIATNVQGPFLIGPDVESKQWVDEVAQLCHAPSTVLTKVRLGDRKVRVEVGDLRLPQECTPVLVDDIVSSGETLLQALQMVRQQTKVVLICLGIHGLFSDLTNAAFDNEGARLVCTNTVPNLRSQIDISRTLAKSLEPLLCP